MYKFITKNIDNEIINYFIFSDKIIKADHDKFKKDMLNVLDNKTIIIFDFINVSSIEYSLMMDQATFMTTYKNKAKENVLRSIIIIPNYWCKMMLHALFFLQPPITPYVLCDNYE